MKKYYVIVADVGDSKGQAFHIYVSDNSKGSIFEFEAENFTKAQEKIHFMKNIGNGEHKYL